MAGFMRANFTFTRSTLRGAFSMPLSLRYLLLLALFATPFGIAAHAEDQPVNAPAADSANPLVKVKDTKPAKKEAKPSPDASQSPELSPAEIIDKASAFLNDARLMTADFVQIGTDGARSEGQLYVSRPGKLLFRYNPPSPLEIVADGRSVAVRDQNLGTQDLYFIQQTPLKFLLADHIDLTKDLRVTRVGIDDKAATVEIEDKQTFGGKSVITLLFDPTTFALKQWTVVDPQGFQTVVTLFDLDLVSKPDPELFRIDATVSAPATKGH
jgi:outer membrane lipoprotein-sorting protein